MKTRFKAVALLSVLAIVLLSGLAQATDLNIQRRIVAAFTSVNIAGAASSSSSAFDLLPGAKGVSIDWVMTGTSPNVTFSMLYAVDKDTTPVAWADDSTATQSFATSNASGGRSIVLPPGGFGRMILKTTNIHASNQVTVTASVGSF